MKDPEARREYHRLYMQGWYERNKQKHLAYVASVNARRRAAIRQMLNQVKDVPCADCGSTFPVECMDFDHLRDKDFNLSQAADWGYAQETIEAEMAKCEVVCSNCHRIRTKARRRAVA